MIELVPYVLLIVMWNPANPDRTMTVAQHLTNNAQTCEQAGQHRIAMMKQMRATRAKASRYFCIKAPTEAELAKIMQTDNARVIKP